MRRHPRFDYANIQNSLLLTKRNDKKNEWIFFLMGNIKAAMLMIAAEMKRWDAPTCGYLPVM